MPTFLYLTLTPTPDYLGFSTSHTRIASLSRDHEQQEPFFTIENLMDQLKQAIEIIFFYMGFKDNWEKHVTHSLTK